MSEPRYEFAIELAAGLASGFAFGVMIYVATSLSFAVSANVVLIVIEGTVGGALAGLAASLIYSRAQDKLVARSPIGRALVLAAAFAFPWGLFWLFALPMTVTTGSTTYTMFIHKLGIETPWLYVPVASQQITDLEELSMIIPYILTYIVVVLMWVLLFGLLLGCLWRRRIRQS